jgi:hypothetical protein
MVTAEPVQDEGTRRRTRRFGLALLAVVLLLATLTVAYVRFYRLFLADPNQPPSVKAMNPRVLVFEITLWSVVLLGTGFAIFRIVKSRR